MNLYHKVEAAFDSMADALKAAMNVADNSEETELYSDLADECIGLRDKAHRDLTNLIIKKAAPAVSATEAAKNDSDKESISSVAENGENVKHFGTLHIECIGEHEAKSTYRSRISRICLCSMRAPLNPALLRQRKTDILPKI